MLARSVWLLEGRQVALMTENVRRPRVTAPPDWFLGFLRRLGNNFTYSPIDDIMWSRLDFTYAVDVDMNLFVNYQFGAGTMFLTDRYPIGGANTTGIFRAMLRIPHHQDNNARFSSTFAVGPLHGLPGIAFVGRHNYLPGLQYGQRNERFYQEALWEEAARVEIVDVPVGWGQLTVGYTIDQLFEKYAIPELAEGNRISREERIRLIPDFGDNMGPLEVDRMAFYPPKVNEEITINYKRGNILGYAYNSVLHISTAIDVTGDDLAGNSLDWLKEISENGPFAMIVLQSQFIPTSVNNEIYLRRMTEFENFYRVGNVVTMPTVREKMTTKAIEISKVKNQEYKQWIETNEEEQDIENAMAENELFVENNVQDRLYRYLELIKDESNEVVISDLLEHPKPGKILHLIKPRIIANDGNKDNLCLFISLEQDFLQLC